VTTILSMCSMCSFVAIGLVNPRSSVFIPVPFHSR
jgi:hypothetical protein